MKSTMNWKITFVQMLSNRIGDRIKLYIGDALQIIQGFEDESFDLAFIDADKESYWEYFETILPKIRKRRLYSCRYTLWYGKVVEKVDGNDGKQKCLEFNNKLAKTIGRKGNSSH